MKIAFNVLLRRALPVLERLERQGYEAVLVGGCVRDTVIGTEIHDVDIATSATPAQVMSVFPRCIPTGLQHGTVTVRVDDDSYEVTTYRTESEYEAYRRPSGVQFVSDLREDLLRRDFTMNAMAIRPDGVLVDPFGGCKDLAAGVLRSVGLAEARFQEDALRMVRAVRFAANMSLRIESDTWRAMNKHRSLLRYIAMERVGAEADKMMAGQAPRRAWLLMAASGLLTHMKRPVLSGERLARIGSTGCPRIYIRWSALNGLDLRWGALCLAFKLDEQEVEQLAKALCFSNQRKRFLQSIGAIDRRMAGWQLQAPGEKLRTLWIEAALACGKQAALDWIMIGASIPRLQPDASSCERLRGWLEEAPALAIKDLAVNGSQLAQFLQRPSGPWLGRLLDRLLAETALGRVKNNKQALLDAAGIHIGRLDADDAKGDR